MGYLLDDLEKTAGLFNRYEGNEAVAQAKKKNRENSAKYNATWDKKHLKELQWSKANLRDEKARADMARKPNKSPRRLKLEEKYQEQGLTKDEAELRAFRNNRTRKRLAAGLGVGAALGAAYGGYKYHDYAADKTIKAGKTMQHIRAGEDTHYDKGPFFTSHSKSDNEKYRGFYGKQLENATQFAFLAPENAKALKKAKLEATKDIKISSRKNAKKAFKDMIGNDEEKIRLLKDGIAKSKEAYKLDPGSTPKDKKNRMLNRAEKKLAKGKIDGDVYDAAQIRFTNAWRKRMPEYHEKIEKGLYESLKGKGYHGIGDRHDQKYTGYGAKSSNILFDAKDRFKVKSDDKLSSEEINKNFEKSRAKLLGKNTAKQSLVPFSALPIGAGIASLSEKSKEKDQDKTVREYRKANPGSKLSYNEIIKLKGKE